MSFGEIERQVESGTLSDELLDKLDILTERRLGRTAVAHRPAPDRERGEGVVTSPVARCRVVLGEGYGSTADVRHVIDVLNAIVSGVTVASIANSDSREEGRKAWDIVRRAGLDRAANSSFSPGFADALLQDRPGGFASPEEIPFVATRGPNDTSRYLPDPMKFEVYTGALTWLQRELANADPALYRRLFSFSFASIQRVQRRSPTAIVMLISFAVAMPAALVFACLKAAEHFQRSDVDYSLDAQDSDARGRG